MKIILEYQLFLEKLSQELINDNQIYHGVHPATGYEYITILDKKGNVKGFATNGYRTDDMEKNNIFAIGTILGKGLGDLLYSSFIKKFGKIIPTTNESDLAKRSWEKKFNDTNYTKSRKENIGFYDRYKEEDFLNTIFDITEDVRNQLIIKEIEDLPNKIDIYHSIDKLHKSTCAELARDKKKLYTIGQSKDRDEILERKRINPKKVPYITSVD